MWHACEGGKVHAGFWWGIVRESDHLEDLGVDWTILLKGSSRNWIQAWSLLIWLRTGTGVHVYTNIRVP